jgi:hypothetical protein
MNKINVKFFKKTNDKSLYRLLDANNKDIYIKLFNVCIPFNLQYYNNKLYMTIEIFSNDDKYDDNINLINMLEDCICESMITSIKNKQFCSVIKKRDRSMHIKCMLKRDSKDILLDGDNLDIKRMTEYHKLNYRYDIVIKVEILWENDEMFGAIFYLHTIKKLSDD